ncbi:MAG: 4Fe-4S dicluster domain-containing protein [Coriobacteriaceae bacterium]|nr:4Fe-4S dicluster domain-containing protein [Coriobacteriaceae bacterium]
MGGFKLGKMTLRSLFSKPATVRYPYEKRELYPAMRGHIVNDIDACILCGMCVRVCPADALVVDRKAGDWTINPYKCVQCANCVGACPKSSLSMEREATAVTSSMSTVTMHKDVPAKPAAGAARPKRALTPEQEAKAAAIRAKKAAKAAAEQAAAAEGPAE